METEEAALLQPVSAPIQQREEDELALPAQARFALPWRKDHNRPAQLTPLTSNSPITQLKTEPLEQQLCQLKPFQLKNNISQTGLLKEGSGLKTFIPPVQKKGNRTGLPDNLKSGIENLSGFSMDDVKVHYHSDKPAQLQALAYAQGSDIHIGPGQEKHLPHEAWHLVQQRQGRVQPTMQMKQGLAVNDAIVLENEADVMGGKALQIKVDNSLEQEQTGQADNFLKISQGIVQLKTIETKGINGLTHLVEMTKDKHIYNSKAWLENEHEEVHQGDTLKVNLDNGWYSRRGINQEINWERDASGAGEHLWLEAVELNTVQLENRYVRAEMLMDIQEQIPKKIHSIWVQGDYRVNPEAHAGIRTRQGNQLRDWVNIMWLYNTGAEAGGFNESLQSQRMDLNTEPFALVLEERSFVREMEKWKSRPEWVSKWLPILEILWAKKSYITMSDIMRMIILYYEGGMYLDVKIEISAENATFKERPMVFIDRAHFYSSENWAIMANSGCRMIEDIMEQAYNQFPSPEELLQYPVNYQPRGQGKEGKTHVSLHEDKGVWNVIERLRANESQKYPLATLDLKNPRPKNSWTDAYDDRPENIIQIEKLKEREESLANIQGKINRLKETKRLDEEEQSLIDKGLGGFLKMSKDEIRKKIAKLEENIKMLEERKQKILSP
jgi:hypothetical protein